MREKLKILKFAVQCKVHGAQGMSEDAMHWIEHAVAERGGWYVG